MALIGYGSTDRCTGGTPSVSQIYYGSAANIFDDNDATWWQGSEFPAFIKYDFGSGITWKICKVIYARRTGNANGINAYTIQCSNNDSNWTDLKSGNFSNADGNQTVTFTNKIAYRYIKIVITSSYGDPMTTAQEVSMYEGIFSADSGFSILLSKVYERHEKLWTPKLLLPEDLGFSY